MTNRRACVSWLCGLLSQIVWAANPAFSASQASLPTLERVTVLESPRSIADFVLTDQHGRPRTLASLRGAPVLVFFGFTHCPDVCPAALTKLRLLHESEHGVPNPARVVMISVDGERDTPAVMKRYLASFSVEFIGLTGHPRAVTDIAARFAAVAFKEPADNAGNYGFFHSGQVFLLDGSGNLRASFADATVDTMAVVTKRISNESGPPR